jgi:hypothetical protein
MKSYIFETISNSKFEYFLIESNSSLEKALTTLPQNFFNNVNRVWTNTVLTVDKKRDSRLITNKQLAFIKSKALSINDYV